MGFGEIGARWEFVSLGTVGGGSVFNDPRAPRLGTGRFILAGESMDVQQQLGVALGVGAFSLAGQAIGAANASSSLLGTGAFVLAGQDIAATQGSGAAFALALQGADVKSSGTVITYAVGAYAASTTRSIVMISFFGSSTAARPSSVVVDGNSFSPITSAWAHDPTAVDKQADAWISAGPLSAGAGSVVVTYSAANSYFSAVALYNLTTTTPAAGTPSAVVQATAALFITAGPVNIPTGGGALFASFCANGATETVGSGNAIIDATVTGGGVSFVFGHATAVGASVSVTLNYSGSDGGPMTLVPWGP